MGGTPAVAAVAGLYTAFLAVGWMASRKARGGACDFILAGRAMPLWVAVMTMTATWVDGGYLLGTVEGISKKGGSLALGLQGGVCFGLSLILGGLFFAKRMRALGFTTLVDLFEARFGKNWAAVLCVPAVLGETIWSAELLAALGATLVVMSGADLRTAILFSAGAVVFYTLLGGLWSVAYTDAFQLALIPLGLLAALPFALAPAGGLESCWREYLAARALDPAPTLQEKRLWWDTSLMLIFGGIPWNCYFQRVFSCKTPEIAARHSYIAGALTILLTIPPALLGMAAWNYPWSEAQKLALGQEPSLALPMLLRIATPAFVGFLGLGAIIGAVTSSLSASLLSAASMLCWNFYRRLLKPAAGEIRLRLVVRALVLILGAFAAAMALSVHSVQQLWFFTSDLVFVLLVPQLTMALLDPKANRIGSIAAFVVSLTIRLLSGEPLLGIAPWLPFPYKSLACLSGMVLLPVLSRLTLRWDPPKSLARL